MGTQERRSRQKGVLRQEILDTARDLFAREGYENVTMRRIADQIEYSPTTIYLHFKDKAELLHQVCEDTFSQLADHIERLGDESDDPVTTLRKGLRAYIDFGLAHPNHYRVTFDMPSHYTETPTGEYFLCTQGGRAFSSLVHAVEVSVRSGRFPRADVQLASQILWAAIHGLTSLMINHPNFPWADPDALIDALIDSTVKGLESA